MTKKLMAAATLLLAVTQAGVVLAQSSTPAFQNNTSEASRQAGNNQASAELFYMLQQLQGDVRRLQGEVEEQRHLVDRLEQQGRDRYIDLDQRILKLTAAQQQAQAAASAAPAPAAASVQAKDYRQPSAEESKAYNGIVDLIRNQKKYDQAITQIYEFLDTYPEGDLTVNAYYWLGEVYLVKPQLEQAKQAFSIVATRFADHRKAPDSTYKLGVTLDRLNEKEEASRRMQTVVKNYPDSSAAKLAQSYLDGQSSGD
ncbi:tol-pal system protein YbgF [Marinobacter psychrophilus]|uniref:tol-pal system protein YbgF n=1 Tax=Marinobacter psychrophilus TaxID=330734 RepID=UPI001B75D4F0|nr:tol-pal system protein YbgF [Marinobacter psychrophilus]MBQ0764649.1 tol-pal system protein YbgF [Marinobacter psychrophilus]MBQ0843317.1 tol-pal system protein YbgF [Marinobacter psychrophilus]